MFKNNEINHKLDKILNILEKKDLTNKSNFDQNMYIKCLIHELRTPITSISLGLNLIENDILNEMEKETNHMNDIQYHSHNFLPTIKDLYKTIQYIENTLTKFAIIQNGILTLNPFLPFNIHYLFETVEKIMQHDIKEKRIKFEYHIDENIYKWFYGDNINIKHCIINLIKNAIKYGNNTNNKIKIDIKGKIFNKEEQTIVISITDNNNLIPIHIKEKLFEAFNSTSGSGLGLYICKKIIELHNGYIEHEYLPKHNGNIFNITLKLKKCEDESLHINEYEEDNSQYSFSKTNSHENLIIEETEKKYNIIFVDDSELNLKLMKNIFEKNHNIHNIMTSIDGLNAINLICNHKDKIDIVFIDNQMPNLNGTQTVQLLRGINFDKLIFGITGNNEENSDFYNCGVDYVFYKPFDKNKIKIVFDFLDKKDIMRYNNKKLQIVDSQLIWVTTDVN
jgi:CheY-like chemotaxis protein